MASKREETGQLPPEQKRSQDGLVLLSPFILLALTFAEYRILYMIHSQHIRYEVEITQGITTGHAMHRAFQNRLLGPWVIVGVKRLSGNTNLKAYQFVMFTVLLTTNLAAFIIFIRLTRRVESALLYCMVLVSVFVFVTDDGWTYIWDYFSQLVHLVFAYAVLTHKRSLFFIPLFLVGIVNREQALFIPLWLCMDAFGHSQEDVKKWWIPNPRRLAVGLALTVLGVAYTKIARDALFVKSSFAQVGSDLGHKSFGNAFQLYANLSSLADQLTIRTLLEGGDAIVYWFLLYCIYFLVRHREWIMSDRLKLLLLILGEIVAVFLFGIVFETRVWIPLVPFFIVCDAACRFQRIRAPQGTAQSANCESR